MPPRTDPRAGFMLVEVLAALVVTAALVAVVMPFAGQLLAHWQAGQAGALQADVWMRAVSRLADDVAEALPVHAPGAGRPALTFSVDPKRIELVRPALGGSGAAGLEQVTYRVEAAPSGERLVRAARALSADGAAIEGASQASAVTILEGGYRFCFTATGKDGAAVDRWAASATMPLRLDLAVATPDHGRVPFSPIALPLAARATVATVVPLLRQVGPRQGSAASAR